MEKDSDFARKAFADAVEKELDAEYEAFKRKRDGLLAATDAIALTMGLDNMEKLSKAVILGEAHNEFTDFISRLYMCAFHDGYTAHKEEV